MCLFDNEILLEYIVFCANFVKGLVLVIIDNFLICNVLIVENIIL